MMNSGYHIMREWILAGTQRQEENDEQFYVDWKGLSGMIPPRALIHESQCEGVHEMLSTLFNKNYHAMGDEYVRVSDDMRRAVVFLAACSTIF